MPFPRLLSALALATALSSAGAALALPAPSSGALGLGPAATPAAMCGYTCRSGGRYIPGPPDVCYDRGLQYCGSSRGPGAYGPPPEAREFRGYGGGYGGGGCRTVTIERDDGSVRRIRRCD